MFSLGNFIGRVTALQHWQTYGTLEGEMESQIQREFLSYLWGAGRVHITRLEGTVSELSYNSGLFGDLGISGVELVAASGGRIKATPHFSGNFIERQYKGVWFDFWEREEPRVCDLTSKISIHTSAS